MQRLWSADELGAQRSLRPEDVALLAGMVKAGKLGFAAQLAFWRQHGRFPAEEADLAPAVVAHLAAQVGVGADALDGYAWAGRSGCWHRLAVLDHLAVASFDEAAEGRLRTWLTDDVLPRELAPAALDEELGAWFARSRVTRPGAYCLGPILRSAQAMHDDAALQRVAERLDAGMRERLGALLAEDGDATAYARLAADPGRVGLESLLAEIAKLERLRALALPPDLLRGLHPDQAKRFRRRAAVESAWELRRHTAMEVERQSVNSHGQSEVAFAFCRMLGFQLLPRLKAISAQRLYLPEAGDAASYPNLACILMRGIDWALVEQQYDEIVRYTTAMAERTAAPEAILRRFTRGNGQHPTYKALAELGNALKTVFLCRYLVDEALRREIHEGLNVVETWNSANGFIFFGKGGEVASNRLDDQEISVHALHLLQACLVYVNTLMLQRVLAEPGWLARMTPADRRGLTPLVWGHVSPYGTFDLDMEARLDLDVREAA